MIGRAGALFRLAGAGLRHYRREHALLGAATAVAVAVLVGALVVGDSVRGSLRAAFTARLGAADDAVLASAAFSADPERGLAARLAGEAGFAAGYAAVAPLLRLSGVAYGPEGAPVPVTVFGVDRRFFEFHGIGGGEIGRGAVRLSRGLREEWGAGAPGPGEALILRVDSDPAIAASSLFGEKEEFAVSRRRTVEEWPASAGGAGGPGSGSGSASIGASVGTSVGTSGAASVGGSGRTSGAASGAASAANSGANSIWTAGAGPAVGDFEIFPRGGAVRAVFLRLDDLSRTLASGAEAGRTETGSADAGRADAGGTLRANTLLLRRRAPGEAGPSAADSAPEAAPADAPADAFRAALGAVATLEDFGLTLRSGSGSGAGAELGSGAGAELGSGAGSESGSGSRSGPRSRFDGGQGDGYDGRDEGGGAFAILESRGLVLTEAAVSAATAAGEELGLFADPVLTWLAGTLRAGERETPYSLVAGLPERLFPEGPDRLIPGTWLREDLALRPGDPVEVEFLSWEAEGRFGAARETFRAAPARERTGWAADPTLSPEYPGVTDSARIGDWDPPFPVDLARIRRKDEDYWEEWRTLPKAFLPLAAVRRLASAGGGGATSVRFTPAAEGAGPGRAARSPGEVEAALASTLVGTLDPDAFGLVPIPVREQGIEASRGATDFGLYFLYFSFFLLASTLVLIVLLFRLGIERRLREIGLLLATGWPRRRVSSLLLTEVGIVAFLGAGVGALLGVVYASGMIRLLTGVWGGALGGALGEAVEGVIDAAGAGGGGGAAPLELFVRWQSVGSGALGGLEMACLSSWWTLRRLLSRTPRTLLSGSLGSEPEPVPVAWIPAPGEDAAEAAPRRPRPLAGPAAALGAGALLALTAAGVVPETPGFFGAGGLLLAAALLFVRARLRSAASGSAAGSGTLTGIRGLALRAAALRPGRSLAALALIAFAAFLLVAVESFRKRSDPGALPAGAGGFLAITETVFGVPRDPNAPEGREALGLPADLGGFRVRPLRLAGDEDASCLNLYRPDRPRILGVPRSLADENRFPFGAHLGETPAENENPWRLLWRERAPEEPIPVLGDQNSMTYVLKWPVGETRTYPVGEGGGPVAMRLVGTLWDSVFQGELLMAERDLLDHLPAADGYRVFLVDRESPGPGAPGGGPAESAEAELAGAEAAAAALLAEPLRDYGGVSRTARARLAEFHRVENTYLSTFQALGGLGLLLGTLGLALVLFRNAAERRREWALLAAVGYRRRDFAALGFWENAFVLTAGLGAGAVSALLAVFPVLGRREAGAGFWESLGGSFGLLALLLVGVLALGLSAGAAAARLAANRPPAPALRAE